VPNFSQWGPATVLAVLLAGIVTVVGGVVTVAHPETLSFAQYLADLKTTLVGVGVLAVGRGIHLAGQQVSDAHVLNSEPVKRVGKAEGYSDPEAPPEPPHEPSP
jgi:hypothetical protein